MRKYINTTRDLTPTYKKQHIKQAAAEALVIFDDVSLFFSLFLIPWYIKTLKDSWDFTFSSSNLTLHNNADYTLEVFSTRKRRTRHSCEHGW